MRRELLFHIGDACDPARLAETARVLRAQPYIREATVLALPGARGGVDVLVTTRDEWSLGVSGSVSGGPGFPLRRARLGEENVQGAAIRAQLHYDGTLRRPAYDADLAAHQFFGLHEAELIGGRSSVGPIAEERFLRPFRSEYDRTAWRESARYRHEPFAFVSPILGRVDQPLLAMSADIGAAKRFGTPGWLLVAGAALSVERLVARGAPLASVVADDSLASALLADRFAERQGVRVLLFAGARALRFTSRAGVDAVHAYEDVREGVEGGLVVGKSVFGGDGLQRDWFAAAEIFVGKAFQQMLVFARGKIEGRYLLAERRWDGVLADGRFHIYTELGPRSSIAYTAGGAGGWHTSTPFQLTLGGPDGIRGYGVSTLPVGRRVELMVEHRYFLGTLFGVADVGTATFVDVGRGWAGDAMFGADTGVRAAVGGGLRFATPRGSRRTYRLDLAVPLLRGRGVEVQLAVNQQFGVLRGEPADVERSRERLSSTSVFNYPLF
ncbi:MAG: hypothetical protein ABSB58_08295 [Gemmatimonadales bacterium]